MRSAVQFIPIATTLLALGFSVELYRRWTRRGGPHHLWFCLGALTYAAGTITESATTLFGWHEPVFRLWYITGALLGGAPLAQGSVYLHVRRPLADRLAIALVTAVVVSSAFVLMAPVRLELVEPYRLTGKVLGWPWVRAFSPFINLYAFVFLVGGAIRSAVHFARKHETRHRFIGNVMIALAMNTALAAAVGVVELTAEVNKINLVAAQPILIFSSAGRTGAAVAARYSSTDANAEVLPMRFTPETSDQHACPCAHPAIAGIGNQSAHHHRSCMALLHPLESPGQVSRLRADADSMSIIWSNGNAPIRQLREAFFPRVRDATRPTCPGRARLDLTPTDASPALTAP